MFILNGTAVITIAKLLLVTSLFCCQYADQHSVGYTDSNFHSNRYSSRSYANKNKVHPISEHSSHEVTM